MPTDSNEGAVQPTSVPKDIEALVDHAVDELAPDASYLDIHQQKDVRYAPLSAWLELVAWNIVIAFYVNLAASYMYQRLQRRHDAEQQRQLEEKLAELTRQIEELRHTLVEPAEAPARIAALDTSQIDIGVSVDDALVADILIRNGWPPELAKDRARHLVRHFEQHVRTRGR